MKSYLTNRTFKEKHMFLKEAKHGVGLESEITGEKGSDVMHVDVDHLMKRKEEERISRIVDDDLMSLTSSSSFLLTL